MRATPIKRGSRTAAADINPAGTFRQCVKSRTLGNAYMRSGGKLESTADDGAMQNGDHWHLAELNLLECAVPQSGMGNALRDVALV